MINEKLMEIVKRMKADMGEWMQVYDKPTDESWSIKAVSIDTLHDYASELEEVLEEGGF